MLRNKTITHLFLALWQVMSFASCASDTASDALVPQDEKVYLQVQVNVDGSDATRASTGPNGGDDGDGRENGVDNENQVNSLAVYISRIKMTCRMTMQPSTTFIHFRA